MASSNPHQGGSLSDMAVEGTNIPGDAGQQRLIPSVPNPEQLADASEGLGAADTAGAADNSTDMPRGPRDVGQTGEVETGTGDQLPSQVETKRLHYGANEPHAKGHQRDAKFSNQRKSDFDKHGTEDATVEPAPGEENDTQDAVRDRKGL